MVCGRDCFHGFDGRGRFECPVAGEGMIRLHPFPRRGDICILRDLGNSGGSNGRGMCLHVVCSLGVGGREKEEDADPMEATRSIWLLISLMLAVLLL